MKENGRPLFIFVLTGLLFAQFPIRSDPPRFGMKEMGLHVGHFPRGENNALTDVTGVRVGHRTLARGDGIRTGVTVILPHTGNLYREKVHGAIYVSNGFGKLMGSTQVQELGTIETPIALTNTLNVPIVAQALIRYTLEQKGNEAVRSVNPVVAETNDSWLNDIRGLHVSEADVFRAIQNARGGSVRQGNVGAGTGTRCLGWKGGIGTASRLVEVGEKDYKIGVLVQSNFGGHLRIGGLPIERWLMPTTRQRSGGGSCVLVIGTDAPIGPRNLLRLARRSIFGMARVGAKMANGSGDYAIAFSIAPLDSSLLPNGAVSPLFEAVMDAAEEAILNSLFWAERMRGKGGRIVEALPLERVRELLSSHGLIEGTAQPVSRK